MLMQHIGVGYFGYYRANCLCDETLSYARDCEVKNEGSELLG
ncbi:Uncharacterised protein [Klebsiella pneumoniae]|uniref:Uncharacterized protein n=1 Tax=Klebsiella pneumoniae TaxID=573 RepID=A0A3S4KQG9_KLEPN|nr:Uncharacterised protein [Klebsiella pneumoniae]